MEIDQLNFRSFLALVIVFSMSPLPGSANYEWSNEITVGPDDMLWEYTEEYSDDRSVIFKTFIDVEFGDNDDFVSAWELLKVDVMTSSSFREAIERNMDVMIDNSSRNVTLLNVEASMSPGLMGPVNRKDDIVNHYQTFYEFRTPLTEDGSSIWFQGEPGTPVRLNLPSELAFISVEGIDNKSVEVDEDGAHIFGEFGFTGEVAVLLSVKVPEVPETDGNATTQFSFSDTDADAISFLERIFPGITEGLLD